MPKKECRERSDDARKAKSGVPRHKLDERSTEENNSSFDESVSKYGPRQIARNWEKYGQGPRRMDREDETEEFKSEKNWDAESVSFSDSKLFTLDVELLASGLACIPFYERVDIDKNILSQADIEMCDKKAEESFASYKIILDKFLKRMEHGDALADLGKTQATVSEEKTDTLTAGEDAPENAEKTSFETEDARQNPTPKCDYPEERKNDDECNATNAKSKVFKEENLEDWLDSVLDD